MITSQVDSFGGAWGEATLTSDGYELVDVGVAVERAVTGGTGPFAGARGQAQQHPRQGRVHCSTRTSSGSRPIRSISR